MSETDFDSLLASLITDPHKFQFFDFWDMTLEDYGRFLIMVMGHGKTKAHAEALYLNWSKSRKCLTWTEYAEMVRDQLKHGVI
jgi:hypothetical protein